MKKFNEHEHEGSYMVVRNLYSLADAVKELLTMVDESSEVESWMEHKISIATQAVKDVRDAMAYDQDEGCCGCGTGTGTGHGDEDAVEVEVLKPAGMHHDDFGLSKMMGAQESIKNQRYLGSASINEKRELVVGKAKEKIIVEMAQKVGNLVKVKSKSGKIYEYMPHFGSDLEIMRCEGYGIKIKK
jgi:hypothetical protein